MQNVKTSPSIASGLIRMEHWLSQLFYKQEPARSYQSSQC